MGTSPAESDSTAVSLTASKAANAAIPTKKSRAKKPELIKPLPERTVKAINKWKASVLEQFLGIDSSPLAQIEIDRFFYLLRRLKEIECGCYSNPPPWFVERAWGSEMRTLFSSLREQVRHAESRLRTRDVLWRQVGLLLVGEIKDPELLGRILTRLEQVHAGNHAYDDGEVRVEEAPVKLLSLGVSPNLEDAEAAEKAIEEAMEEQEKEQSQPEEPDAE